MSRAFRLGLFIFGALAALAVGVFIIGDREMLFSSTYSLRANFKNVAGLADGADVRVGGIHEGTVKHIDLPSKPDQDVTVVMNLGKATRAVLKKDSVASIKSEGLIGDKYVEITFGSPEGDQLKSGDTIATAPPVDISDLIAKTDQILDSTKGAVASIEGTASNMETISSNIKQGKGTVGAMINDKTMYQQATAGATAFAENMEALKHNFFLRGFFKKRGYEDSTDMGKHEVAKLPAETPEKTFQYGAAEVFSKPDAAKLKDQKALGEVGSYLEKNPFSLAVIAAGAGMKGDSEKDRQLTEAQAMVVRDYLTKNFRFDDTKLKTMGMGKTEDDAGKLVIMIYPNGSAATTAQNARAVKR